MKPALKKEKVNYHMIAQENRAPAGEEVMPLRNKSPAMTSTKSAPHRRLGSKTGKSS